MRAILDSGGEAEVVAEAGDGREAVELARAHRPDVALLDVRMPRLDGLAAAEEIVRTVPGTAVAVLTTLSERGYVARALAGGATGFLLKSGDPYELLAGVRAVAGGAAFLSPKVARYVIEGLEGADGGGRLAREDRDRERAGVGVPCAPPPEGEQPYEHEESGLRTDLGRVPQPRRGVVRVVGDVAVEPAVHEVHGHRP
ncbi:response regulator transcription factor [Streptomyces griseoincarnatus]